MNNISEPITTPRLRGRHRRSPTCALPRARHRRSGHRPRRTRALGAPDPVRRNVDGGTAESLHHGGRTNRERSSRRRVGGVDHGRPLARRRCLVVGIPPQPPHAPARNGRPTTPDSGGRPNCPGRRSQASEWWRSTSTRLVVHTWDLATAIGADVSWDDEILRIAAAAIHARVARG